jgi:hypothetical protein
MARFRNFEGNFVVFNNRIAGMKQTLFTNLLLFLLLFVAGKAHAQFKYFGLSKESETSSIGLQVGSGIILGDVQWKPYGQGSLYYQYRFQRWLAGRITIGGGRYYGADTKYTTAIEPNKVLSGGGFDSTVNYLSIGKVYQNYQATIIDISLQAKINIIELLSRNYNKGFSVYALGGVGVLSNITKTNALGADGKVYPYNTITSDNTSAVTTQLAAMQDKTYETYADYDRNTHLVLMGGAGVRMRLSEKIALGLEGAMKYTNNDYLDGQAWKNKTELSKGGDLIINAGLFCEFLF